MKNTALSMDILNATAYSRFENSALLFRKAKPRAIGTSATKALITLTPSVCISSAICLLYSESSKKICIPERSGSMKIIVNVSPTIIRYIALLQGLINEKRSPIIITYAVPWNCAARTIKSIYATYFFSTKRRYPAKRSVTATNCLIPLNIYAISTEATKRKRLTPGIAE